MTSVLPILLSAQRVSPPSDGPAHGGKVIGKDPVTYEYKQVGVLSDASALYALRLSFLAHIYSLLSSCNRCGELTLPPLRSTTGEDVAERSMDRT